MRVQKGEDVTRIQIKTADSDRKTAPDLFGLFFEDINRGGDGGLYPEMLRNRTFEDSIPPEDCDLLENGMFGQVVDNRRGWSCPFNNGEGKKDWAEREEKTDIPAWYADGAKIFLEREETLNPARKAALRIRFRQGGSVRNTGYHGISVKAGGKLKLIIFAKTPQDPVIVRSMVIDRNGDRLAEALLSIDSHEYKQYDAELLPERDADGCSFALEIQGGKEPELVLGFTSLMPEDTYMGHGLRKDLCQKLKDSGARFLRFPGGCVVEGYAKSQMMKFSDTIGHAWERPQYSLMWYFRTTNGLGYHEFLQLCEDLRIEPMYVCNCGMSCQARGAYYEEGGELDAWIGEAMDAIAYATAPADTYWGKKRSENGHPAPFRLRYVEIGNENMGEKYVVHYRKFYHTLKKAYPQITFLANEWVRDPDAPVEIVDEHYYDTPEFFAENRDWFDHYGKDHPPVFVGEYQAFQGKHTATLYSALCETMFLMDMEKNPEKVLLSAYAPLMQNTDYTAWYPSLIVFDQKRSCAIVSYYTAAMMAKTHGTNLASVENDSPSMCFVYPGVFGIAAGKQGGVHFRRIRVNGEKQAPGRVLGGNFRDEELSGDWEEKEYFFGPLEEEVKGFAPAETVQRINFGGIPSNEGSLEGEIFLDEGASVTLTMLNRQEPAYLFTEENGGKEVWNGRTIRSYNWTLDGQTSCIWQTVLFWEKDMGDRLPCRVPSGRWVRCGIDVTADTITVKVDGDVIQTVLRPSVPVDDCSCVMDEKNLYVRIVHLAPEAGDIRIRIDEAVEDEYTAEILSSEDPDVRNTLDEPERIVPVKEKRSGASGDFVYRAGPYSFSVLTLRKKR